MRRLAETYALCAVCGHWTRTRLPVGGLWAVCTPGVRYAHGDHVASTSGPSPDWWSRSVYLPDTRIGLHTGIRSNHYERNVSAVHHAVRTFLTWH